MAQAGLVAAQVPLADHGGAALQPAGFGPAMMTGADEDALAPLRTALRSAGLLGPGQP